MAKEPSPTPVPAAPPPPRPAPAPAPAPKQDAPLGSAENPMRMTTVAPPPTGQVIAAGAALTPGQVVGIDPIDPKRNAEEAKDRANLPNQQTTHEAERGLDAISGTPSPGITAETPLTGRQQGQTATDMSGRPPISLAQGDEGLLPLLKEKLTKARDKDRDDPNVSDDMKGFRSPADLGLSGGVVSRIVAATNAPVEVQEVPNGHAFPDSGRRYRLK